MVIKNYALNTLFNSKERISWDRNVRVMKHHNSSSSSENSEYLENDEEKSNSILFSKNQVVLILYDIDIKKKELW